MDRTALEQALSQALLQLQESDQKQQATEQKLDEALVTIDETRRELELLKELYSIRQFNPTYT